MLLALCGGVATAATGTMLPRGVPTQEGVDPNAISVFVDSLMAVPETDIHHVVIVRHGKIIAEMHPEPFSKDDVHTLYSCSKTFTMLAIGMLIDDGKLSVSDKVIDLLPDKAPAVKSDALKAMTVKHLLTMTAGIKPSLTLRQESDDWATTWLAQPVTEQGVFQYDSMCTFVLAAIVQRITGRTLLEFLNERFFHPLGIYEADWEEAPDGINVGGWGLRLTAESMAKAGICMMNKGRWQDRQLVSTEWIEKASQGHTNYRNPGSKPTDTNQGYCYQMWRCLLPGTFRADGAYGQFIVMSPENDLVVVITGVSHNTGKELACIWNHLIPGVKDAPLMADEQSQQALENKLAGAALPLLKNKGLDDNSILLDYTFDLEDNVRGYKQVILKTNDVFNPDECTMTIVCSDGSKLLFPIKYAGWAFQRSSQVPPYNNAVNPINLKTISGLSDDYVTAGNFAWIDDKKLVVRIYWTTWIVPQTFTFETVECVGDMGTEVITNDEGYPGCAPEVIKATCIFLRQNHNRHK